MANWFERAIAAVSPHTAAKRASYRRQFELIEGTRAFDGASRGRRTQGWRTQLSSADAELATGGSMLRQRSRDLVRNNPYAAKIVSSHADYIVGTGIMPKADTGNPATNELIDALFDNWSKSCSPDGTMDFYGMQYVACREMIEGGDVLARKRFRREKIEPTADPKQKIVPLNVQLLEAEHLDDQKNGVVGRNTVTMGVELDAIGARRGYWMFQQHPGASVKNPKAKRDSQFVKASEVAHLFEPQRLQVRGVPWLAPVMIHLKDLDDYNQAELIRKKVEACVVGVVIPGDDEDTPIGVEDEGASTGLTDADGFPVERFEPGMIAYAHGGKDIKFNNPSISAGIESYLRVQLRRLASGVRLPYELLTGDMSQSNFSSNRMGILAYRRFVEHVQFHIMIPMFCQVIWDWFIEAAKLAGAIGQEVVVGVQWSPPKHEAINPVDDVKADILAVRGGIRSMQDVIGSTGRTPGELLNEVIAWNALVDAAGIVFDTDPRKISLNGQLQMDGPGESDDGKSKGNADGKKTKR